MDNKNEEIINHIKSKLRAYFIEVNEPYPTATEYNYSHTDFAEFTEKDKNNGKKLSIKIHNIIREEVEKKFGLAPKKLPGTKMEVDLWDENNKFAYEILLGNGDEFWKDVLKAILLDARKLLIFCRKYPDETVKGYETIKRSEENIRNYLTKQELAIKIILIEPDRRF